jgi:hypothetical protein
MQKLYLTPKEFGLLGSSFFFLHPFSAILVGLLANWILARWLRWSRRLLVAAAILMIGTVSFLTLAVCPRFAGCQGRPGIPRDSPGPLQMVPRRETGSPNRRRTAGRSHWREHCPTNTQLDHCSLFLALGVYSQATAGWLAALPRVVGSFVVLSTGWVSRALMMTGAPTRLARGVLGSIPLVFGGLMLLVVPFVGFPPCKIALLLLASGLTGSIYVVCPPLLSEFTPVSQRSTAIAVFSTSNTMAGISAPILTGATIERAPTPLEGYYNGLMIAALVQIVGGLAGLIFLHPAELRTQARPLAPDRPTI